MSNNYHRIIRKIVIGFGSLFDNISLIRFNQDGTENRRSKVPIIYSSKEKYVSRLVGDPNLDKKIQVVLPRMSFDMTSMEYDSTRKQVSNFKNYSTSGNPNSAFAQYNPVPYNLNFELYVYVRNIEDGTQIIEHILPYFTPDYTIKLNLVPSMGVTKEVPILLNKVDYNVEYEGERDSSTRIIIWTLSFTAKAFIYGPVQESKVIKDAYVTLKNLTTDGQVVLNMSSGGFGSYKEDETVYQGYSLDTAAATAKVISYNTTTNKLTISSMSGSFKLGYTINGSDSFAEHTLLSYDNPSETMALSNTIVVPSTANVDGNYVFSSQITELPKL
jgi:hypothetical protein